MHITIKDNEQTKKHPYNWLKKEKENLNSVSLIHTQTPVTLRVRGAKSL